MLLSHPLQQQHSLHSLQQQQQQMQMQTTEGMSPMSPPFSTVFSSLLPLVLILSND